MVWVVLALECYGRLEGGGTLLWHHAGPPLSVLGSAQGCLIMRTCVVWISDSHDRNTKDIGRSHQPGAAWGADAEESFAVIALLALPGRGCGCRFYRTNLGHGINRHSGDILLRDMTERAGRFD